LTGLWPRIKLALQYLIEQDGNGDGLIENRQHNTLDVDLYGPSSWLSSLYLAALSSGEAMAKEMMDIEFADECRRILKIGYDNFSKRLWNGEYFIQIPTPGHPDALVYGDGCEVDQVIGEAWRWQIGLNQNGSPRLFDPKQTKQALEAVYKYNFLPDVGPFRDKYTAGMWYALPGEGGLVICTFPKGDRNQILGDKPTWAAMYFNECMTGFEYEVAAHMIAEGLVLEGLEIIRTVHDRYDPLRHNPWNEVECSDHYARCMAVYGAYHNLCGYEHHGPKGHIGFSPKLSPHRFKAAFTACSGWGTYEQSTSDENANYSIRLKYGFLELNSLAIEYNSQVGTKSVDITLDGKKVQAMIDQSGKRILISFDQKVKVNQGSKLTVKI
ncbi:MAG: GH116 family glycosyl hydrolase, partial [Rhabdochlamydiaceae bacterium]